jgi:plastocyanin
MLMRSLPVLLISLAACSDSGSTAADARQSDGPGGSVVAVTCPATVPLTVDAADGQSSTFTLTPPGTTPVPLGGIVKFTMHAEHNVVPDPAAAKTDAGLKVNQNETKCLQFTQTGTFGFMCSIHGFKASITVMAGD